MIDKCLMVWYNWHMRKQTKALRSRTANAALGSVRAEGLRPTVKTQNHVKRYVNGQINASTLRRVVVQEMKALNR